MKRTLTLITAIALSALTGCASINTATQKVGGVFGAKNDTARSATGGAILGCAGGAVLAHFLGKNSDMLKGCAAGAAVGAIASVQIHRHELAQARKLADEVNKTKGVKASLTTRQVVAKDAKTGKREKVAALDKLTINLPASRVRAHASDVSRVVHKAAVLAGQSQEPTTLTVRGTTSERAWLTAEIHAALKSAAHPVKVIEHDAREPALVISPVPEVRS